MDDILDLSTEELYARLDRRVDVACPSCGKERLTDVVAMHEKLAEIAKKTGRETVMVPFLCGGAVFITDKTNLLEEDPATGRFTFGAPVCHGGRKEYNVKERRFV